MDKEARKGLMPKTKSIKNIRQDFKDKGIFYTPPELAQKLKSYVDREVDEVYDPTCGAGSLLRVFGNDVKKYGQELDEEQLNLIDLPNFEGYAGDTLEVDKFADRKFECILANPPFSTKWNPEGKQSDPRFENAPCVPPPSKADWAFMLHILYHLKDDGIAVVLEFPGILYRGNKEGKIRQWFVENNYIDRVVEIEGNTFEDTSIQTVIIVLKKNKSNTDVIFEAEDKRHTATLDEIEEHDFCLTPSRYMPIEDTREEIDIRAVNKSISDSVLNHVEHHLKGAIFLQKELPSEEFYLDEFFTKLEKILHKYKKIWLNA